MHIVASKNPALIFEQKRFKEDLNLIRDASSINFQNVGLDTHGIKLSFEFFYLSLQTKVASANFKSY